MEKVSGNALSLSIRIVLNDKKLTDSEKLRQIELALDLYKIMNE